MSEIYYAMIIFPIIFMMTLSFIFQSSVQELTLQQWRLQCPYPIYKGIATNLDIIGTTLNYTVNYGASNSTAEGTFFVCKDDPITHEIQASTIIYEYGFTLFDTIPIGWLGYVSDSIGAFFQKADAGVRMAYLFVFAPAQVSSLSFFVYINAVLIGLIAFGAFMVIRGA